MFTKSIDHFRKLYLSRFTQRHYSQFGEDIILNELLRPMDRGGFYVDVGCYHPKKFSNTYALYKKGWSGINIDIEQEKVDLFKTLRPNDYNLVAAVSKEPRTVYIERSRPYDLGSAISDTPNATADTISLETQTLTELIDASPYQNRKIDVLSIDTEGEDFNVISSLDITRYRPKIVILESHDTRLNTIMESDLYRFMTEHGYHLRSWAFYSLVFIDPNNEILKDREFAND